MGGQVAAFWQGLLGAESFQQRKCFACELAGSGVCNSGVRGASEPARCRWELVVSPQVLLLGGSPGGSSVGSLGIPVLLQPPSAVL